MNIINPGILFILGIGVFGGMLGGYIFQKIKIPQVVGYIFIGLIAGDSVLGIIKHSDIAELKLFNFFALGIIGFLVGGELQIETFKKYAKQFMAILLGEGLGAFFLVGIPSVLILYLVLNDINMALAGGVVFGAIASATDPASTIDVLWEYRSQGAVTTALIAIVALDDALAMTLYGFGTSIAKMLAAESISFVEEIKRIGVELFGALILGVLFAFILNWLLRLMDKVEKGVAIAIGFIMLVISISIYAEMDVILATMAMGFVLTNLAPRRSEPLFKLMRNFSIPIYVLFFVLVGARLGVSRMPGWLWGIVLIYVLGRSLGKMGGAFIGAKLTKSGTAVRRYLGMGLFAQGGVAIGLSIMASQSLNSITLSEGFSLGDAVIFGVTATTMIVQLLGPPMVKLAITLAGERGRNITEEDVLETLKVEDVMEKDPLMVKEEDSLKTIIEMFRDHDQTIYPVLNSKEELAGIITLDSLKHLLASQDAWQWMLAADVMTEPRDCALVSDMLKDVYLDMIKLHLDQMMVVQSDQRKKIVAILDVRNIRKHLDEELIRRQNPSLTPVFE
jgi:Kef-type K+ transport system membrane component KefB/predicted transcriptional regulator